jgi:hypothetical protein
VPCRWIWLNGGMRHPTVRQVYALAAALCEQAGEEFPETAADASQLIERLRLETGHPRPRRDDTEPKRGRRRRRAKGEEAWPRGYA